MSKTASTFGDYEKALHQMLDENEALRAEHGVGALECLLLTQSRRPRLKLAAVQPRF